MTAFEGGKLYTIAYDRTDGREIWRTEAPAKQIEAFHKTEGSPAASTPATDGKQIVSYFGSCGLFCYDLTGKELWKVEMPPAELIGEFGSGVSPIIAEDMVVLVRDQKKDSRIYAFDLATGAIRWGQTSRCRERKTRRTNCGDSSDRGRYVIYSNRTASLCFRRTQVRRYDSSTSYKGRHRKTFGIGPPNKVSKSD